MTFTPTSHVSAFAQDVLNGLNRTERQLSSKWFYDDRGTELFRQIMRCPEYYLTEAEARIYRHCVADLVTALDGRPFDLIELGAGDGSKTQILLEQFLRAGLKFTYRPIDLSGSALSELGDLVKLRWPSLDFDPIQGDYFEALDRLGSATGSRQRLILFPGANVGNFTPAEAVKLLKRLRSFLSPNDLLLTGFDLKKDPGMILAAYNDTAGYTAAFNLNLLERINRELGGNFELDCWRHWQTYDPTDGAARSFLLPIEPQTVHLRELKRQFQFRPWEPIAVEISQKYNLREIEGMADAAGFSFLQHFTDDRQLFTNSLWQAPTQ